MDHSWTTASDGSSTKAGAMRPGYSGITVLAGLLLLTGCGDEEVPAPMPAESPSHLQNLHFDTLAIIGDPAGDAWEAFVGIWDVTVAQDGTFAVLDSQAPAVHVYDDQGGHLTSISEDGFQLGQLSRPSGASWTPGGELHVWDPSNRRISLYSVSAVGSEFVSMRNAEAFGETGFCALGDRTYLSFLMDGRIVHEVGTGGTITHSFSEAPSITGIDAIPDGAREMALEDLTPSRLLCLNDRIVEVSYFQPRIRLHDPEGSTIWTTELDGFRPVTPISPDGMGVGFEYAAGEGSHMARSVVPWGDGTVLVQYELRAPGPRPAGQDFHGLESRLIDLATGEELDRTSDLPLFLGARGDRFIQVRQSPQPQVVVLERHQM